jgi:hypothetical protein
VATRYARAGLPDYSIVNLVDGPLEVNREPAPDPAAEHGWSYRTVILLGRRDLVALSPSERRQKLLELAPSSRGESR